MAQDRSEAARDEGSRHSADRLRVLMIGHQFQVPTEGQAKAAALARFADLELHVLAPSLYREGEVRWRRSV